MWPWFILVHIVVTVKLEIDRVHADLSTPPGSAPPQDPLPGQATDVCMPVHVPNHSLRDNVIYHKTKGNIEARNKSSPYRLWVSADFSHARFKPPARISPRQSQPPARISPAPGQTPHQAIEFLWPPSSFFHFLHSQIATGWDMAWEAGEARNKSSPYRLFVSPDFLILARICARAGPAPRQTPPGPTPRPGDWVTNLVTQLSDNISTASFPAFATNWRKIIWDKFRETNIQLTFWKGRTWYKLMISSKLDVGSNA